MTLWEGAGPVFFKPIGHGPRSRGRENLLAVQALMPKYES